MFDMYDMTHLFSDYEVKDVRVEGDRMFATIHMKLKPTVEMITINPFIGNGEEDEDVPGHMMQNVYREASEELLKATDEAIKVQRKKDGRCLECGSDGEWINMVLVCKEHGRIAG